MGTALNPENPIKNHWGMGMSTAEASNYFIRLRHNLTDWTLNDANAWKALDRIERKAVLRLAGYNVTATIPGQRGELSALAAMDWADLPGEARYRINKTARRTAAALSRFKSGF